MKKLISALLCTSVLAGSGMPVFAQEEMSPIVEEKAIVHQGKIGTADWTIDRNGVLTIGEGEFTNYDREFSWPWKPYLNTITRIDGTAKFKPTGRLFAIFADWIPGFFGVNENRSITSIDLSGWDTSAVTDMTYVFSRCESLSSLNITGWDTSSVSVMFGMFSSCESLKKLDLSSWNTSSVTDLYWMFYGCNNLTSLNLSGWDTSSVTNMGCTFSFCRSLTTLDLSGWNTSKVTEFEQVLGGCDRLSDIRYTEATKNLLLHLPVQSGWYQNSSGPYDIKDLPKVPAGKTAQLTRKPLTAPKKGTMHRLYNPNSGEHFYTGNTSEKDHLASLGWKYEGTGWIAPEKSGQPVYRLYNPNAGDHHYTLDENERKTLIRVGWNDEGIGWYSDEAKGVPLYRQYNPNAKAGSHNYTTDKNENDGLVKLGWKAEGIGWYGIK